MALNTLWNNHAGPYITEDRLRLPTLLGPWTFCKLSSIYYCETDSVQSPPEGSWSRGQPCFSSIHQGAAIASSRSALPSLTAPQENETANGFISLHQGLKRNLLWLINSVKAWLIHPHVQRLFFLSFFFTSTPAMCFAAILILRWEERNSSAAVFRLMC